MIEDCPNAHLEHGTHTHYTLVFTHCDREAYAAIPNSIDKRNQLLSETARTRQQSPLKTQNLNIEPLASLPFPILRQKRKQKRTHQR